MKKILIIAIILGFAATVNLAKAAITVNGLVNCLAGFSCPTSGSGESGSSENQISTSSPTPSPTPATQVSSGSDGSSAPTPSPNTNILLIQINALTDKINSQQSQIDMLIREVSLLRTAINQITTSQLSNDSIRSSPPVSQNSTQSESKTTQQTAFNPKQNLKPGMNGNQVVALQRWLINQGYSIPSETIGFYDNQTKNAVTAWQKAVGIKLNNASGYGYFGPLSRQKIK